MELKNYTEEDMLYNLLDQGRRHGFEGGGAPYFEEDINA